MPKPSVLEIAKVDLYTDEIELMGKYDVTLVQRLLRIRVLFNRLVATPSLSDKDFVEQEVHDFKVSRPTAYADLQVVKTLLPDFRKESKEFQRYRANEMLLETYQLAKLRKDTKTMERAATSYARINNVDKEEEKKIPIEMILVQPFTPTVDPRVLGMDPVPEGTVERLIKKYSADTVDFLDVDYEEVDTMVGDLFKEDGDDEQ